jgi:UDP-glucose 4-epimerase
VSGYIGKKLCEDLCGRSWVDAVIGIDIRKPKIVHPKFTFYARDVRESLIDVLLGEDIDTICHLAWILPPLHDTAYMEDVNKRGTRNVLSAAAKARISHVLHISSTTAYGFHPDNDLPLTEESPLRGNEEFTYSKNKREMEGVVEKFSSSHPDITTTVLRPSFVVGPGFDNPLAKHLQKRFVLLPRDTASFQYVHEDDLVAIIELCLHREKGGIYNVGAEGTLSFSEMIGMLGNIRVPLPYSVMYVLNNIAWFLRLSFLTEFPSSALPMTRFPWIASSERLKKETGYVFRYDTRGAFLDFARAVKGDTAGPQW